MSKIPDILSKRESHSLDILGVAVKFGRLNLGILAKYEEEGVALNDLMGKIQEFPVTWGTRLAWDLMLPGSKSEFEGSLELFRDCLLPTDIQRIVEVIAGVATDSMPVGDSSKKEVAKVEKSTG